MKNRGLFETLELLLNFILTVTIFALILMDSFLMFFKNLKSSIQIFDLTISFDQNPYLN
jgi:hypothetical protein